VSRLSKLTKAVTPSLDGPLHSLKNISGGTVLKLNGLRDAARKAKVDMVIPDELDMCVLHPGIDHPCWAM
jgi:hypothetical protein